jgi:hypothetical protein
MKPYALWEKRRVALHIGVAKAPLCNRQKLSHLLTNLAKLRL